MSWRPRRNIRRARRTELLRVKAESAARRTWVRRLVIALALASVGALGLHAALRYWTAFRDDVFLSRQFFGLRAVEVNPTLVWLDPAQVVAWTGVRVGDNLLAFDLNRLKRDLELVPQIEEASLERVLPDLLRIHIRERRPVARVRGIHTEHGALRPATLFLDAYARVMPPPPPGHADLDALLGSLPVITGLGGGIRAGGDLATPTVRAALELVRLFPHSPMSGQTGVTSVDVADPDVLQLTTREGAEITLPLARLDHELHRWRLVHDAGARQGRQIQWLDLSVTNNCPVLWLPEPSSSSPSPTPTETTQLKHRHV